LNDVEATGLIVYCLFTLQCSPSTLDHCSAVTGESVQFARNEVRDLFSLLRVILLQCTSIVHL